MKTPLAVFVCTLIATGVSRADEASSRQALHARWVQAYQGIAEDIEMRKGNATLALHPTPLLAYTNPVRETSQHGAIYLWTAQGRPAVFGSIWSAVDRTDANVRNVTHEWHSLAETPLRAARGGELLWDCNEPGIEWQPIRSGPAVASSRSARLVQMRALARQLTASIEAEGESELRLMPQPLYRYPETVTGATDGALFAFAMGTDPELLVLIEVHEHQGQPVWRNAFARFGARSMAVRNHEQAILWSCDEAKPAERNGKYHLHYRAAQLPATLDGTR